jgi:hypothetical protein
MNFLENVATPSNIRPSAVWKEACRLSRRAAAVLCGVVLLLALAVACSKATVTSPSGDSGSGGSNSAPLLTAPSLEAPSDDEQLSTLRPTLTIRTGTTSNPTAGARTYEFQIADNSGFAPIAVTKAGIAEDSGGKTTITLDADLASSTRFYWRARLVQGSNSSPFSSTGRFRTRIAGFNRPGELYDPLAGGETIGTPSGSTTFVSGKGLKIESETSFLRYQLAQTLTTGEFSVEVEGLRPDGPGQKLKIFSMSDTVGDLIASRYQLSVQYRGLNGNPDNCIAFKAVWGNDSVRLEPDFGQRAAAVMALDPAQTYYWQGSWNPSSFRLVIRSGGIAGNVIYDRTISAPAGTGPYAPNPHFAFLGANSAVFNTETGSWPGVTYRNVWIGDKSRPTSLGSALRPDR